MPQLIFSVVPPFLDLADSALGGGQALADANIQALSRNAKFGAVRCEIIYMGFFVNGNTVPLPVSPVDGYTYARAEVMYLAALAFNRMPAAGFTPGQKAVPAQADLQAGALYNYPGTIDINDATGVVCVAGSYWKTAETGMSIPLIGLIWVPVDSGHGYLHELPTNDGTLKVWALCQRSSVNVSN
jgi:hypothetical protein